VDQPTSAREFNTVFGALAKDVFRDIVRDDLIRGGDASAQAGAYTVRGKPDFVLAYLLVAPLSDDEKREMFAQSYERRAMLTEERAREFDRRFHRSFELLIREAGRDREAARHIRAGRLPYPAAGRPLPMR
jgi:hypothetical protein